MKKTIDHHIQSSLKEYLQYRGQKDLEAFHTVTLPLYRYEDERFDKIAYGSPEAGWAYNTDISGVVTPNISGYSRGDSGMSIDFRNGRFLFDPPFAATGLYAQASVNELNWYISNNSEAQIIFETNYQQSPVYNQPTGYLKPDNYILPAVFIKTYQTESEPYSLGGLDWSVWNYRIICMMPNEMYLAAIGGLLRDVKTEIFPLLKGWATNQLGDLRLLNWNYANFMADCDYYAFISDSTFKIEEPDVFIGDNPKMYLGIGNMQVRLVRQPRNPSSDPDLNTSYALTDINDYFDTDDSDRFVLS